MKIISIYLLAFLMLCTGTSGFTQSLLLLKNNKGKTIKKLHKDDQAYFLLSEGKKINVPYNHIDSITYFYCEENCRLSEAISFSQNTPLLGINRFNAGIFEISSESIDVVPISFDSVLVRDLRQWPSLSYELDLNKEAQYQKVMLSDIEMMYIEPSWRKAGTIMGSVFGLTAVILGPVLCVPGDGSFDFVRYGIIAGGGLSIHAISTIARKTLVKRAGYYTTNPEIKKNTSKKYKVVKLEAQISKK